MSNPYFTNSTTLVPLAKARAGDVETKFALVEDGFDGVDTAITAKANLASPTFTGTPAAPTAAAGTNTTQLATTAFVHAERTNTATLTNKTLTAPVINSPTGIVKADVGLGNVDNTSDAGKPISTLTQAALDLKAPIASPTFTGVPSGPTAAPGTNTTQLATTEFVVAQAFSSSLPSQGGNSGKYLTTNGTNASWGTIATGGDVSGPASAVDSRIASFDGTSGKLIKDSGKALSSGDIVGTSDSQTLTNKTWNGATVGVGYGGTGLTSYTIGDLLYANDTTTIGKLAAGAVGNVLLAGGAGAAPSWGKVSLTSHISGTLALGNGGTGQTTAQAAMNSLAASVASGYYLRGNGTNVVMATIQAADVPTLNQNTTGSA